MELEGGISFDLGQEVRLSTAPEGRTGWVAGVLLIPPYSVLVRWRHAEVTFEAPENLVAIEPMPF